MPRRRHHEPLRVLLNNRLVGHLTKEPGGAIGFEYDGSWLNWKSALPVSLSLPLREAPYRGEPVTAVFENLLPDSADLRHRVADRVGAGGTDAYNLLAAIGRDCVGALQFLAGDADTKDTTASIEGEVVGDDDIEALLRNLASAPLGLNRDDDFRISIAGAQEKTALLRHEGKWLKPHGTTPTTHLLKKQIGRLQNGIDLPNSIENEFYCLKLLDAFGLPVNAARIETFGNTKALVVERFDRRWTSDGRLLRLPQEDCCQALSVPPSRKYQNEGGPGIPAILDLLKGSDTPEGDQSAFMKAQILFWLIGATDGHAKNFSIFLRPGGGFHLTPFYDVLSAEPSLDAGQIQRKQMKLAMSVGSNNHYRIEQIAPRPFIQSGQQAKLPKRSVANVIEGIASTAETAIAELESRLPPGFPEQIHASVKAAFLARSRLFAQNSATG